MKYAFAIVLALAFAGCGSSPEPKPVPEPVENARQAYELAVEAFEIGRYREAIASFERAERQFLSIDDSHGIATSAISQAEVHLLLGENAAASVPVEHAKAALVRLENPLLRERIQLLEARLALNDDPVAARKALRALQDAVAPSVALQARMLLCELALNRGETRCVSALAADDAKANAQILQLQARVAQLNGDTEDAIALLESALKIHRAVAFRPGIAAVHEARANLAVDAGDKTKAEEHLQRALYLRLWIQDRVHAAEILAQLAQLAGNADARKRYSNWRETLLNDSAMPEWDDMMQEIFRSR